ncbi:RING-H2 finger protein ATL2-like, partial [Trifolium medium]|nr:RING-H2 finger protein ATL2-like [Trifolium medium]
MVMEIVISLIILFVGIGILVSIHFCIVGRAFRRDSNSGGDIQGQSSSTRSTSKGMFGGDNIGDLKNLPCFDYVEPIEKGYNNLVDCAVCLESFK